MRPAQLLIALSLAATQLATLAHPRPGGPPWAGPRAQEPVPDALLTVAERSGFTRTATHAEVVELCERYAAASKRVELLELGTSHEGRSLPLLVLAKPPIRSAAEARERGNPVVFAFGNIHAGEVCGKEALLMLARDLMLSNDPLILEELTIVLAPIYNADGNERMAPDNRPGQVGPEEMGQRANAMGLDLNRDWVKLEAPETRALVGFLNEWDPHLVIDTHTTNGSHHRYSLTYAPPLCPAGDPQQVAFVRDGLLPMAGQALAENAGYDSFFYGSFDAQHERWSTYSGLPRYGGPYRGLRGQMSVLSEAYSYASYEQRVLATKQFCREMLAFLHTTAGRKGLQHAYGDWRRRFERPATPEELAEPVAVRFELASSGRATIHGWVEQLDADGRRRATEQPHDYDVEHFDHFAPTLSVTRPQAYALPAELAAAIENLALHGIRMETLEAPRELAVEVYTVRALERDEEPYQGHHRLHLEVDAARAERRELPAGTVLVRTWQPLGNLAIYLLEPAAEDGLAAWNLLDRQLAVDRDYPILRVVQPD